MTNPYTHIANLTRQVDIPADGIISKTIYQDEQVKAILFGFDAGQELSEHTASMPAVLHIVQGEASLTLGSDAMDGSAGTWVHMPAHLPHSITATTPTVMLLLLLKPATR